MVLEPEPVLVTDPTLMEVLDELRTREPIFHRRELGTTRCTDRGSTQRRPWLSCRCFQGSYPTSDGALSTAACPAQKSVTRAASSAGHSSEGRARDPVRTAERASFIAAVVSAHSEGLHSPRSSVAIIRVGHMTRAAAQARSVLLLSLIHISEPTRLGMISYA